MMTLAEKMAEMAQTIVVLQMLNTDLRARIAQQQYDATEQTVAPRFAMPAAYADRAFMSCLLDCIEEPELVEQFDRLYGCNLSLKDPRRTAAVKREGEFDKFVTFVHDTVYTRLPDETIVAMRAGEKGG